MQVAHMHGIACDVEREVIGFAIGQPWFDATSGHPHAKTARMVIPAIVGASKAALRVNVAPKLSAPNHKSIVQKSALSEIGD